MATEGITNQPVDVAKNTEFLIRMAESDILMLAEDSRTLEDVEYVVSQRMWNFSSVLDYCYYDIHCHFQNDGKHSLGSDVTKAKTPFAQKLKWSADRTQDEFVRSKRIKFVKGHCTIVFGEHFERRIPCDFLKWFQENLLSLQALIEVDKGGHPVKICAEHGQQCLGDETCNRKVTKLVRATRFDYETNTQRCSDPTKIYCEELDTVSSIPKYWSDTTTFNVMHFLRNFATHRSLPPLSFKNGWFNLRTEEFKAGDEFDGRNCEWVFIPNLAWISIPDIKHLRDDNCLKNQYVRFFDHPLAIVCARILDFVKQQRRSLLRIVIKEEIGRISTPESVMRKLVEHLTSPHSAMVLPDCL